MFRQPGRSVLSLLTLQIYKRFLYLQTKFIFFFEKIAVGEASI